MKHLTDPLYDNKRNMAFALVENFDEPVFWVDTQLKIEYANSSAVEMFLDNVGSTVELVGSKFPWFSDELQSIFEKKRGSFEVSTLFDRAGEELVVTLRAIPSVEPGGKYSGLVIIVKDITADKHAQQKLMRAIWITNSIVRAAPSAIGMVKQRAFSWVSDRMCEITEYSRDELIGRNARFLYPSREEYERAGREKYLQLEHDNVGTVETTWRTKSGKDIRILLSSSATIPDDLSQGVVFTALDITATRKLEEEQLALEVQMQRTQKLESLGVLAGGIAHDFNNILVSILGNADFALSELSPSTPVRPYIKEIVSASKRAADLCQQLLAYSGKGRFVIERLNLKELVEQMLHMLEVLISKNVILKCRFADQVPPVEADATQLRQIIMNLVINGSEAIENRSGVISINTGVMECDEEYLRTTFITEGLAPGIYSYIEVADTGKGMDTDTREKIFEPFFTTKFSGRGLGLAAVLGIIRGHHGAIKVYSEPGTGTTFKVILPASLDDSGMYEKESMERGAEWHSEGLILLVDDEETVRVVAKRFLQSFGFDVLTAEDGRVAVDLYTEHHARIDAVLMDLTMPRLDGEAAFSQMRVINPDVRVIFSSGYNEQEVTERFIGKGVIGFIQKPYLMAELKEVVKKVMR